MLDLWLLGSHRSDTPAVVNVLATDGSIREGGPPRGIFVAIAVVSRSGDSNPADGGGDGIGATGTIEISTGIQ